MAAFWEIDFEEGSDSSGGRWPLYVLTASATDVPDAKAAYEATKPHAGYTLSAVRGVRLLGEIYNPVYRPDVGGNAVWEALIKALEAGDPNTRDINRPR